MAAADVTAADGHTLTRMKAASDAATGLVQALPAETEFTLLAYGNTVGTTRGAVDAGCRAVTILVPLAPIDPAEAATAIGAIKPDGSTPIALALQRAADSLPASGPASIVLVSDGEDTCHTSPCDAAADLHRTHPELTISTVGFRTENIGDAQLSCIANATGGLFVTADNATELATRLHATGDVNAARTALTTTGLGGAEIGQSAEKIRQTQSDLPAVTDRGETVVIWRDCDLTFRDGVLVSIAPRRNARTIDGVTVGSPLSTAITAYGPPLDRQRQTGNTTINLFSANKSAGTAYRITADGNNDDATITDIVLCHCLPNTSTSASAPAAPEFGSVGPVRIGMTEDQLGAVVASLRSPSRGDGCITYSTGGSSAISYGFNPQTRTLSVIRMPGGAPGVPAQTTVGEVKASFPTATVEYRPRFGPNAALLMVTPPSGSAILAYQSATGDSADSSVSRPAFGPIGWNGGMGCPAPK